MTRLSDERLAELAECDDFDEQAAADAQRAVLELQSLRAAPRGMESAYAFAQRLCGAGFANGRDETEIAARDAAHNLDKQALAAEVEKLRGALGDAAKSLESVAEGRADDFGGPKPYAHSRALVARAALAPKGTR